MDTGCGQGLISSRGAKGYPRHPSKGLTFSTANGKTTTNESLRCYCEQLEGPVEPFVLSQTPHVMSIGKRVVEQKYSFIWCTGSTPLLITPSGSQIPLVVNGNVPYMAVGEADFMAAPVVDDMTPPMCQAAPAKAQALAPKSCLRSRSNSPIAHDVATIHEIIRGLLAELESPEEGSGSAWSYVNACITDEGEAAAPNPEDDQPDGEDLQVDDDSPADGDEAGEAEEAADENETPAQRRQLRKEALSIRHALTHLPKNKYCGACRRA